MLNGIKQGGWVWFRFCNETSNLRKGLFMVWRTLKLVWTWFCKDRTKFGLHWVGNPPINVSIIQTHWTGTNQVGSLLGLHRWLPPDIYINLLQSRSEYCVDGKVKIGALTLALSRSYKRCTGNAEKVNFSVPAFHFVHFKSSVVAGAAGLRKTSELERLQNLNAVQNNSLLIFGRSTYE